MVGKASDRFVWAVDTPEAHPADRLLEAGCRRSAPWAGGTADEHGAQDRVAFPSEYQPPSWRISSLIGTSRRCLGWSASHFCDRVKQSRRCGWVPALALTRFSAPFGALS